MKKKLFLVTVVCILSLTGCGGFYSEADILQLAEDSRTFGYIQAIVEEAIASGEVSEEDAAEYASALEAYVSDPTPDNLEKLSEVTTDVFYHINGIETDLELLEVCSYYFRHKILDFPTAIFDCYVKSQILIKNITKMSYLILIDS